MKKETVFIHLCLSGLKKTPTVLDKCSRYAIPTKRSRAEAKPRRSKTFMENIKNSKHEKTHKRLPSLKFCTKIFLQRLFQLLPAAQARPPHSVLVPQCVPGERSSVLSWLPINSEKRRFDSPPPLCAPLKEASHAQTRVSSCRTLTDLHANV